MIKLAAMQTELANLIKGVEGVKDANVMITLPTQSVFLSDSTQQASAAIMLKTDPGHQFTEPQINALYNLVVEEYTESVDRRYLHHESILRVL